MPNEEKEGTMRRERALKVVLVFGGIALLRWQLSIASVYEARPCVGDDDEPLRHFSASSCCLLPAIRPHTAV